MIEMSAISQIQQRKLWRLERELVAARGKQQKIAETVEQIAQELAELEKMRPSKERDLFSQVLNASVSLVDIAILNSRVEKLRSEPLALEAYLLDEKNSLEEAVSVSEAVHDKCRGQSAKVQKYAELLSFAAQKHAHTASMRDDAESDEIAAIAAHRALRG